MGENAEISESSGAEAALRESEARYRALAELCPDALLVHVDGRYVYANRAAGTLLGAGDSGNILGKSPFDYVPVKYSALVRERIRRVTQEGQVVPPIAYQWIRLDGSIVDVEVAAAPIVWRGKIAVQVVARNITERKSVEEELSRQNELLSRIIDGIPVMLAIYDPRMEHFRFNRAFRKILGWTESDAAEGAFLDKVYPDPEQRAEAIEYMRSLTDGFRDFELTAKDGRLIASSWAHIRLTDDRQIAIGIDIRERKAAEEQIRMTLESIGDAFLAYDADWRFIYVNAKAEKLLRINRTEVIGKTHWDIFPFTAGTPLEDELRKAMAGETRESEYFHEPWNRWFYKRCYPRHGGGVTVYFEEITERKRAEEEFVRLAAERAQLLESERAARAEAERANRIKDEFLATVSHELRTPLNGILGWAELLLAGDCGFSDDLKDGLSTIVRNARVQAGLIDDLLDFERILRGKLKLDIQNTSAAAVTRAAVNTVLQSAEAKEIKIELTIECETEMVRADPNRLQQVIWNLLTNAVKFTARGGSIWVAVERSETEIRIVVSDTGQGIKPEFLPLVFERFAQADSTSTRRHRGLGLGLAIVKHLVEMHNGTVRAYSAGEGLGSTFAVSLPLCDYQQRELDLQFCSSGVSLSGRTILAVDDDFDALRVVSRVLQDCGASVIEASSSDQALEIFSCEKIDLLISDIGMPEHDGWWLIKRIRALSPERGGEVPAIALTAFVRREEKNKALLSGFQLHLPKPVNSTSLISAASCLLQRAESSAAVGDE